MRPCLLGSEDPSPWPSPPRTLTICHIFAEGVSEGVSESEFVFVFVFEGGQREAAGFAASVECRVRALVRPNA